MKVSRSKYASKKYPNLFAFPDKPFWVYRKYSSQKRAEFYFSTEVPKETRYEAEAYKKGVAAFDAWLGVLIEPGRRVLIRDIARAVLASKESKKGGIKGATYRSARNQIQNHLVPSFGHYRPDQITPLMWEQYDALERKRGRTALANTRKYLVEILKHAEQAGLIKKVPELKKHDPAPAPPKYLPRKLVRKLLHAASPSTKTWAFIMWKQGARPSEILQYQWSMIHWDEGEYGRLVIPGEITKTGRARTIPLNSRVSRLLKWIQKKGYEWDLDPQSMEGISSDERQARRWVIRMALSPYLFPSPLDLERPMAEYKTGWETATAAVRAKADPYNLRDTFITDCLKRGLSSTFIGRYCDNSPTMIDKKYAVAEQSILERVAG